MSKTPLAFKDKAKEQAGERAAVSPAVHCGDKDDFSRFLLNQQGVHSCHSLYQEPRAAPARRWVFSGPRQEQPGSLRGSCFHKEENRTSIFLKMCTK